MRRMIVFSHRLWLLHTRIESIDRRRTFAVSSGKHHSLPMSREENKIISIERWEEPRREKMANCCAIEQCREINGEWYSMNTFRRLFRYLKNRRGWIGVGG